MYISFILSFEFLKAALFWAQKFSLSRSLGFPSGGRPDLLRGGVLCLLMALEWLELEEREEWGEGIRSTSVWGLTDSDYSWVEAMSCLFSSNWKGKSALSGSFRKVCNWGTHWKSRMSRSSGFCKKSLDACS